MSGTTVDLRQPSIIHLVGIGGAGMSAIATVLREMGHEVSGSDMKDGVSLDRLRALGVRVMIGHHAANVEGATYLAYSTAISQDNVELAAARLAGIPVLSRADILASIAALRRTAAISGTHGKTTTTSMLALMLLEANHSPSFIIGGDVNEIGTSASWGSGDWFVVEADESDGTFLRLGAELALVTNVDPDHLDQHGSYEALKAAFGEFLRAARFTVVCADHPVAMSLAPPHALTYGFSEQASFQILDLQGGRSDISFDLRRDGAHLGRFSLPVPGAHNALNAAGALAAATALGVPLDAAGRALARFTGVARRFAFRGEARGVTFVDDYAHNPQKVAAAIATAQRGGFERIVAVFQPHRYSRTLALAKDFADSFVGADLVVITEVYAAGERVIPGVSSRLIVDAVREAHPETHLVYLSQRSDVQRYLEERLLPGDCCLTMSAGDLTTLPDTLLASLADEA